MRRDIFDIRNIIAALLGIFGVILVAVAVCGSPGGASVNLWTGTALIAVAALFVVWALLRPVRPPD